MGRWVRVVGVLVGLLLPAWAAAQARGTLSGQVTDRDTGQPVVGAQVLVQGTALRATTNAQGRFTIADVPAGSRTLVVVRPGYRQATRTVAVGGGPVEVAIALEPDPLGLEELVVVGYGEARRREVAGAVATVRGEEIAQRQAPNLETALQGQVPGVLVQLNSGTPGAAPTVRIRGVASLSASSAPLYVVDGVPIVTGNYSQVNGTFGGQDIDALSDLNPNDVESIQVLKDASAAAIYGSRGSNGVVLITTKRGLAGRSEITLNTSVGTEREWRRLKFLNARQYIEVYNEGILAGFNIPDYYGCQDDNVANVEELDCSIDTDWLGAVLRRGATATTDLTIRGGTDRVRYFVSGTRYWQRGIVLGTGFERYNGRLNLDYQPTNRLTLGTNVAVANGLIDRQRNDNTIYGPFANALANPPIEPIYLPDGKYNLNTTYANPVALAKENLGQEKSLRVLGNVFANVLVADWLSLRGSVGLDQYNLRSYVYDSPIASPYSGSNGAARHGNSFVTKLTYELTGNVNRLLWGHEFAGVLGTGYETNDEDFTYVLGQEFPTERFRYLASAARVTEGSSSRTGWRLLSFFGRATYTIADRYVLSFNLRRDASSRFGRNNRWATFPSASVLWRVSEEPWFGVRPISDLALRLSYGRTGNQQGIGNFASRGLYGTGANYQDQPGIAPSQLENPNLRWERTDQWNVGLDVGLLDNRVYLTLDAYRKATKDLLVQLPLPRSSGYSFVWFNVGGIENRGLEASARVQWLRGGRGRLEWSTDVVLSHNRNRVTELYNNEPFNAGFISRVEVGKPVGYFYGHVAEGIFRTPQEVQQHAFQSSRTAPGDIKFKDLGGCGPRGESQGPPDNVINDCDRTDIGSPWPDLEGGVTNRLAWRNFDLSFFFQFSYGNEIYNANRIYMGQYGSGGDNHTTRALQRWRPDRPDAPEPRAIWGDPNRNTRPSSRFIEDGSYLRLKNLQFGATLPSRWSRRLGLSEVRLYLRGQNVLTWTKYSGFDPEVNFDGDNPLLRGTDFYTQPQTRGWTIGAQLRY